MAKRKISISREWLQSLGITDVTADGTIYKGDSEVKQYVVKAEHKYGKDKFYPVIGVYDSKLHELQKKKGKAAPGIRTLLVSRVVFAWFYGICPDNYDVDHIDDDQFNNSISNLQLLTRTDNLRKRGPGRNRWTAHLTRAQLEYYNEQCAGYKEQIERYRESAEETKDKLNKLKSAYKVKSDYYIRQNELGMLNQLKEEYEDMKYDLEASLKIFRKYWHYWCGKFNAFKTTYLKRRKGENE